MSGASSKRAPIPADGEFLSDAAERTGYKPEQLARILAWHGAEVRRCWYGRRARPWALRADVDAAVAAWLDTETVQSAALRRDVPPSTLRDWLARAGLERPARHQHWRLPSATIDAVVAERRAGRCVVSGPPKSIWLMVHESQSGDEYSADKAASVGLPRPACYDLADADRDKRDADAIDFILNATRPQTTEALNAYLIRLGAARKRLEALRDRLRGGAR